MNRRAFMYGFLGQLEKTAVTVDELGEGMHRVRQQGGLFRTKTRLDPSRVEEELTPLGPRRAKYELSARPKRITQALGVATRARQRGEKPSKYGRPFSGIVAGRGGGFHSAAKQVTDVPTKNPDASKALNLTALAHETFERPALRRAALGKGPHFGAHGQHGGADVIAKEHNLLTRLKGPGSEEARRLLGKARGLGGGMEESDLASLLPKRMAQDYEHGRSERFSPATKRFIGRKAKQQAEAKAVPKKKSTIPKTRKIGPKLRTHLGVRGLGIAKERRRSR